MKSLIKYTFLIGLFLFTTSAVKAQSKSSIDYAVIKMQNGEKIIGFLAVINPNDLVITTKKDLSKTLVYSEIKQIKIYRKHQDMPYSIITGALAVGAVVAAMQIEDGNVATLVGIGGVVGVTGLSMLLHNAFHPAIVKLKAGEINFETAQLQLEQFIVKRK